MDEKYNTWLKSHKSYSIKNINNNDVLEVYLYNDNNEIIFNKITLLPILKNIELTNDNGILKYNPTKEEDDIIMNQLFPNYNGETIEQINIKECIMLSVDNPKYNEIRNETINILNEFNIPKGTVYMGYNSENVKDSPFYKYMERDGFWARNELVCGMLEIFEKFVEESNGNEWLLYIEDDVRPVNISKNENLKSLYNIPKDAELIKPDRGNNTSCEIKNMKYKQCYSGAYTHAFYISTSGCIKILNYTKKYKYRYAADVDIYKLSKFYINSPTGFDGWSFIETRDNEILKKKYIEFINILENLKQEEKIAIYYMDNIIFNQTSAPCADFNGQYGLYKKKQ